VGRPLLLFSLGARPFGDPWVVPAGWWSSAGAARAVCFDFFFAAALSRDNEAPKEIRASGQCCSLPTYGLGMWLGNVVSGYVVTSYSSGPKSKGPRVVEYLDHPSIGV